MSRHNAARTLPPSDRDEALPSIRPMSGAELEAFRIGQAIVDAARAFDDYTASRIGGSKLGQIHSLSKIANGPDLKALARHLVKQLEDRP